MPTARDLITRSMRILGILAEGETASAAAIVDGLSSLNGLIGSWNTENLTIPSETREEFDLVPSQSLYTFGVGGNFNSSRPVSVESAGLIVQNPTPIEYPLEKLNPRQYANLQQKTLTGGTPRSFYVMGTNPLERIIFWPTPEVAHKIALYTLKPISRISSANDEMSLADGYEQALIFNLSIVMSPEYQKSVTPETLKIATESKASIERLNSKEILLNCDPAITGAGEYDILTGRPR